MDDTDAAFTKWAILQLCSWDNTEKVDELIKIHGTRDKLIPFRHTENTIPLENGEHFMVVDCGRVVSEIIERKINMVR